MVAGGLGGGTIVVVVSSLEPLPGPSPGESLTRGCLDDVGLFCRGSSCRREGFGGGGPGGRQGSVTLMRVRKGPCSCGRGAWGR